MDDLKKIAAKEPLPALADLKPSKSQSYPALQDLKDIFSPPAPMETPDMAKAEIVKELMGATNLHRVTELSNFDIAMLSAAMGINAKVDSDVFKKFAIAFQELRVSHERLGRKEIVEISRTEPMPLEPMAKRGWLRTFI